MFEITEDYEITIKPEVPVVVETEEGFVFFDSEEEYKEFEANQ